MKYLLPRVFGVLMSIISMNIFAQVVSIAPYERAEFNHTQATYFRIPLNIKRAGIVTLDLYTADGDKVKTLTAKPFTKAGNYSIDWDGKDEQGETVPNEAYTPVVTLVDTEGKKHRYDPRENSGGESLDIALNTSSPGQLSFALQQPARVMLRAGIKSGPMMRSILNWAVRGAGKNIVPWDGYDQNTLINLRETKALALVATGFALPNHSIITQGNSTTDYNAWRQKKGFPSDMPDLSKAAFERDGKRLSRHYYLPRAVEIDPRISLTIKDKVSRNEAGLAQVTRPISLRVDMDKNDMWAMQQSLYEVAFFIDHQFISEEEQGFVPLTWRWNPAGLAPGIHNITVNVSGFNGQVGVSTLQIEIPANSNITQTQQENKGL